MSEMIDDGIIWLPKPMMIGLTDSFDGSEEPIEVVALRYGVDSWGFIVSGYSPEQVLLSSLQWKYVGNRTMHVKVGP